MDAREYMAKKGLDQERDKERPNTLEEKAWERAREAGEHRPRTGTPHDWEEWERYHDELAEGAESIDQKIDREAHRTASEREAVEDTAVEHYIPPAEPPAATIAKHESPAKSAETGPLAPHAALLALAVLLPPLAVGLVGGAGRRVGINILLTLLGWIPGVVHALMVVRRR